MKKLLLFAAVAMLSMTACGSKDAEANENEEGTEVENVANPDLTEVGGAVVVEDVDIPQGEEAASVLDQATDAAANAIQNAQNSAAEAINNAVNSAAAQAGQAAANAAANAVSNAMNNAAAAVQNLGK